MAEEFVIRVQVDNLQGRSAAPRSGAGAERDSGTGVNNPALSNILDAGRPPIASDEWSQRQPDGKEQPLRFQKYSERYRSYELKRDDQFLEKDQYAPGKQSRLMHLVDSDGGTLDSFAQQTFRGASSEFFHQHKARIRATATIAVNTAISTYISIHSHRAGDNYRETQMRNGQYIANNLSSIGIAGAIWGGTAAIAFGVNFAISTGARMLVENANFKFDRRMDTNYIHNMSQVAGDLSYGRVFG